MDTFLELLRRKKKVHYHRLQAFHAAVFFLMMGIIGYYFFPDMLESLKMHEWTEGPLYIPKWPFKLCIVVGCALICVRLIFQTIQHSKASLGPHQEKESGIQED